jgi:3-oxoacyl-[acyl-carrier protein] reductase
VGSEATFLETGDEIWRRTLEIDLLGVVNCCRAVMREMSDTGWGRVINIASQIGIKGGAGLSAYAAAKGGVIALTRSLALEYAPKNVLVNAIAPGPIESPMVRSTSREWQESKIAQLPLGRFGTADEVAPSAILLASDPGGNIYVGQTLGPNSGDVMP